MRPAFPTPSPRYDAGNEAQFRAQVSRVVEEVMARLEGGVVPTYTDATRPPAGRAGRVIFNSDDGTLNIDTGADWVLPDGTVT